MQALLAAVNVALAWSTTHPRELAVALLGLGWFFNWALGSIYAAIVGKFSFQEWPRILRTQLASQEAIIIYGLYGASALGLLSAAATRVWLAGHISADDVDFAVNGLLNLAAGAAGLYSLAIWHEVIGKQLPDILGALRAWFFKLEHQPRNVSKLAVPQSVGVAPAP